MDRCLSQETVGRYVRQACSQEEARAVEAHIAGCEQCRRQVEAARRGQPDGIDGASDRQAINPQVTQPLPEPDPNAMATLTTPQASGEHAQHIGPQDLFEGYQILEELPQGGQAVVYKAIHKATKTKVALKVLLPSLTASPKARQYFRQEVELAASLNHPNIVAIRDSGIAQGQYYFSMTYIHGQPLDRYVEAKAPAIREKLILFRKVCDAMAHAHQRGVIHRDLKPSNILVDDRDEPHILDFGLAKTAGLGASPGDTIMPTITGQIRGTVAYMSPEQAAGRPDLVDVRTDVYSLGVVLYQMCTGQMPYDVLGTLVEALKNIQSTEPVRPRQIVRRFDSDAEAIIMKCLAKDPDRRYQSAGELKQDVQRWLDCQPVIAKSISSTYLLRKIICRHKYTATVVGLLLVILLSTSAISFQMYRLSEDRRTTLQATYNELREQSAKNYQLDRRLTFLSFLEMWRQGNAAGAAKVAPLIADSDSREKKGARFLLQPEGARPGDEEFRRSLGAESRWFADFILAEKCMRDGNREQARQLYKASCGALDRQAGKGRGIFDTLLEGYIKARFLDSMSAGRGLQIAPGGQQGGEQK